MYVCIYVHIYMHVFMHIYMFGMRRSCHYTPGIWKPRQDFKNRGPATRSTRLRHERAPRKQAYMWAHLALRLFDGIWAGTAGVSHLSATFFFG